MHLFTVCTHSDGWYNALVESAERNGYELITLGWMQKWKGFVWRLQLVSDAIAELEGDTLMCVVDAYDVVVLVPADKLEQRYRSLVSDGRVLFSADNTLETPITNLIIRIVFGGCLNGRTVNAGAYIGSVTGVRKLLDHVRRIAAETGQTDDQKVLNGSCRELLAGNLIAVDMAGDVFFHATCKNEIMTLFNKKCLFGLGSDLTNPLTRRRPAILHAPGGLNLDRVCRYLELPLGQRRSRLKFIAQNFWREMLLTATVLVCLVAIVVWLIKKHKKGIR